MYQFDRFFFRVTRQQEISFLRLDYIGDFHIRIEGSELFGLGFEMNVKKIDKYSSFLLIDQFYYLLSCFNTGYTCYMPKRYPADLSLWIFVQRLFVLSFVCYYLQRLPRLSEEYFLKARLSHQVLIRVDLEGRFRLGLVLCGCECCPWL